ncbi:MAG: electron transfer flavoprotein subunit alpha/FixB family protein [Candidatus Pacebacteria bacterium]|nr:electron transfer flavoprotein subunit alpha/FixB family protein [Candidatus Paceibacterota bacterium]
MSKKKTGNVWVFIEQDEGNIADVSLELVCKAKDLATELNVKTEAVILGGTIDKLIPTLHEYGCDTVFAAADERLAHFSAIPYTKVIVELVKKHKPNIFMFGATQVGRSLAPRIASKLLAGLTADCTELRIDDFEDKAAKKTFKNKLMQIRPAFGGNIIATIANSWEDPQMVTVREGVMPMTEPEKGRQGEVVEVTVELDDDDCLLKLIDRFKEGKKSNLKNAQIIVSGGYGVGSKEQFQLIRQFADTIGAEVGASRAAVDAGWIDHDHQVGQTGVTVRPRLYIACGISGSVQHRAGMQDSAKIVAINSDPDAPIFSVADYGVVGDLHQVIPQFIKAYKART